jgi:hypothetical protein
MVPYVPRRLPFLAVPDLLYKEMLIAFAGPSEPERHVFNSLGTGSKAVWGVLTRERQLEFLRSKLEAEPESRPPYPDALAVAVLCSYAFWQQK